MHSRSNCGLRLVDGRLRLADDAAGRRVPDTSPRPKVVPAREQFLQQELAAMTRERDRLQRGIYDAAQVQRKLSGPRVLRRGDFEIAAESFASQHVSGDLLTAFDVGERTLFAIGDICGKGLHAAMWFTHLAGLIRVFAGTCPCPAQIAAEINAHFCSLQPDPPMATLFLASLHWESGELSYCNAGHPAPLLLRGQAQHESLSRGGPLLGAVAEAEFLDGHSWLAPGDTLVGYSDGVVESLNGKGDDFEVSRLVAAVGEGGNDASSILFSVLAATQDFAAAQARADDVTLMVVHRQARAAKREAAS